MNKTNKAERQPVTVGQTRDQAEIARLAAERGEYGDGLGLNLDESPRQTRDQSNETRAVTGNGNAPRKPTMSQVLHTSLLESHNETLNEISNLKHDYAIVSAQRNELLAALTGALAVLRALVYFHDTDDTPAVDHWKDARAVIEHSSAIAKADQH